MELVMLHRIENQHIAWCFGLSSTSAPFAAYPLQQEIWKNISLDFILT
jgi:hypothetical protein